MFEYDISHDDLIKLETKLEMIRNALATKVPHEHILAMLDGEPVSRGFFCGPFFGGMEEEDEDAT